MDFMIEVCVVLCLVLFVMWCCLRLMVMKGVVNGVSCGLNMVKIL